MGVLCKRSCAEPGTTACQLGRVVVGLPHATVLFVSFFSLARMLSPRKNPCDGWELTVLRSSGRRHGQFWLRVELPDGRRRSCRPHPSKRHVTGGGGWKAVVGTRPIRSGKHWTRNRSTRSSSDSAAISAATARTPWFGSSPGSQRISTEKNKPRRPTWSPLRTVQDGPHSGRNGVVQ